MKGSLSLAAALCLTAGGALAAESAPDEFWPGLKRDFFQNREIVENPGFVTLDAPRSCETVVELARGEPRDARWVLAGARGNILSLPTVALRMQSTSFLDDAEQRGAIALLAKLRKTL